MEYTDRTTIRTGSIDSLTNFQKNAKLFTGQLVESGQPLVLTVNGKARLVVQDAEAYQSILDELEKARFMAAVRQGLKESDEGLGRPAEAVYAEMKEWFGL